MPVGGPEACDLAVIGGGSGGYGAALAAARRGLKVVLVEPGAILGGTSTIGGVNTWEPGLGGPGLPAELFERLGAVSGAIGLSQTIHFWSLGEPWGWSRPRAGLSYRDSLRRHRWPPERMVRVTFEPEALASAMAATLAATGRVELRLGTRFVAARADGRRVTAVQLESAAGRVELPVRFLIDATAQLHLASALGCATYLGCEPRALYGEPAAPLGHVDRLNGVSLCFRVTPVSTPRVEPLPDGVPDEPLKRTVSITEYPNGDLNLNPLPLMEGIEWHRLGAAARGECERRVYRLWRWLQQEHGFDRYRLLWLAPLTGVREGPRLRGRRVLTEVAVRAGCSGQGDNDRWIALADHALDTHGEGHGCGELDQPYGVPYECLLPVEYDNLAVACRGASFSHLAASSCRLSRTMMQLGHAAGLAAAVAAEQGATLPEVDLPTVRRYLVSDGVALTPDDPRFPTAEEPARAG